MVSCVHHHSRSWAWASLLTDISSWHLISPVAAPNARVITITRSCARSAGASGNYHLFNTSVAIVDVAAGSSDVVVMGMTRSASDREPKTGLEWLVDKGGAPPGVVGAYAALLFYRGT